MGGCKAAATSAPGGVKLQKLLWEHFYPNSLAEKGSASLRQFPSMQTHNHFNFLTCWEIAGVLSPFEVSGRKCDFVRSAQLICGWE